MLLMEIKNIPFYEEVYVTFDIIQELQEMLATEAFKNKKVKYFSIPLNKFISDFDRIDDIESRRLFYVLIVKERYFI